MIIALLTVLLLLVPVNTVYASEEINISVSGSYICSEIEDTIYATLIEMGYSPAGACGILGNVSVENPDFDADLYGNNCATYGLFQWTHTGDRQNRLKEWCENHSYDFTQTEGQLAFALYELNGGDYIAERVNECLRTTDDPRAAATGFAVGFERCIGPTSNPDADGIYYGKIYPEFYGATYQALNKRMDRADYYYECYSKGRVNKSLAYNINLKDGEGGTDLTFEVVPVVEITVNKNLWPRRILFILAGIIVISLAIYLGRTKRYKNIGKYISDMIISLDRIRTERQKKKNNNKNRIYQNRKNNQEINQRGEREKYEKRENLEENTDNLSGSHVADSLDSL